MLNEAETRAKLESTLYGCLTHAVAVTASAMRSDVSAIRIFDPKPNPYLTYVQANHPRVTPRVLQTLQDWPCQEDSVFQQAKEQRYYSRIFRPEDLGQSTQTEAGLLGPIQAVAQVVDGLCVTFPVSPPVWGMIVLIRCRPSHRFTDGNFKTINRLKPAVIQVVKNGYQPQSGVAKHATPPRQTHPFGPRLTTAQLLAKLSQSEQVIFGHLQCSTTERQIATRIDRSPHTIHVHVKNIYRKLGINSRRKLQELFPRDNP